MNWLLARLKEKSTWLAIFTLAGLCGMRIEPELRETIINVILAVAALVAFVFREEVKHEEALPPIEFQGHSESSQGCNIDSTAQSNFLDPDFSVASREPVARLRENRVSSDDGTQSPEFIVRSDSNGYNG